MVEVSKVQAVLDSTGFKKGAGEVQASATRVAQAMKQPRDEMGRFQKNTDQAGSSALKMNRHLKTLFAGFTALAIVTTVTRTMFEFQDVMAQISGVTGIPRATEKFQKFIDTTRELGATTRFSASEAGEGLLFLARAGFSADEALSALPATLSLATAGVLSLGEAADFASNIVQQFGLHAAETVRVVDTLVNSANSANTDVRQLAEALKYAGPFAGSLGHSVEATAASIGALGDAGIQASLAGTNLRGILAALLGPTSQAKAVFDEMNIALEDVNPASNSLVEAFERLAHAGLDADKALEIFGRRNVSAALILATSTEKVRELTEANMMANGIARENATIMNDTLRGAYKSLASAVEELIHQTGDGGLGGVMRASLDLLTDVARTLAGVTVQGERASLVVRVLAGSIKGAVVGFGALIALKAAVWFWGVAKAVGVATGAVVGFNTAIKLSPIGIFAIALGGIATAATIASNELAYVKEDVEDLYIDMEKFEGLIGRLEQQSGKATRGKILDDYAYTAQAVEDRLLSLQTIADELYANLGETSHQAAFTVEQMLQLLDRSGMGFAEEHYKLLQEIRAQYDELYGDKLQYFEQFGSMLGPDFLKDVPDFQEFWAQATIGSQEARQMLEAEMKRLRGELDKLNAAAEAKASMGPPEGDLDAMRDARAALDGLIEGLEFESQLMGQSAEDRAVAIELRKAEAQAIAAGLEDYEHYLVAIEEGIRKQFRQQEVLDMVGKGFNYVHNSMQGMLEGADNWASEFVSMMNKAAGAVEQLTEQQKHLHESAQQMFEDLQFERTLVGQTSQERERAVLLRRFDEMAMLDQTGALAQLRKQIEGEIDALHAAEEVDRIAGSIAAPFVDALGNIILQIKSVEDALQHLYMSLAQFALNELALSPLFGALKGGLGNLMGGGGNPYVGPTGPMPGPDLTYHGSAFANGIKQHGSGDVVDDLTYFSYGGNKLGSMGERGRKEGVFPLTRDSHGDLAVKAVGDGGGGGRSTVVTANFYGVRDMNDMRRSKRQIQDTLRKGLNG